MTEGDPGEIEQAVKRDRVSQLRKGLPLQDQLHTLVERHFGHYDFEIGVSESDETPIIEHVDRDVVKAVSGGIEGVYRELVGSGEETAAKAVVFDYQQAKAQKG